jgi:hypothetical protein
VGYNPSYKWINPTYPMSITGVITHLQFVGSSPPSSALCELQLIFTTDDHGSWGA